MANKPATESRCAQENIFSQEVLVPDQNCKSWVLSLSALFSETLGYSPMEGSLLTRNNGNNQGIPGITQVHTL